MGNFFFKFDELGQPHEVRVNLFTDYDRVRMWMKLSREEVWTILDFIWSYCEKAGNDGHDG